MMAITITIIIIGQKGKKHFNEIYHCKFKETLISLNKICGLIQGWTWATPKIQHRLQNSNTGSNIPTPAPTFQHRLQHSNTVSNIPTPAPTFQHRLHHSNTGSSIPTPAPNSNTGSNIRRPAMNNILLS